MASSLSVQANVLLNEYVETKGLDVLNADTPASDAHFLIDTTAASSSASLLKSDCDAQIIITLPFLQPVKIHSLKLTAPSEDGPREIKLFINQPSIGFEAADADPATQGLTLTKAQLAEDAEPIPLRYVKFQSVHALTIFIRDNQAASEVTALRSVKVFGTPVATTNVDQLKKIEHDH